MVLCIFVVLKCFCIPEPCAVFIWNLISYNRGLKYISKKKANSLIKLYFQYLKFRKKYLKIFAELFYENVFIVII